MSDLAYIHALVKQGEGHLLDFKRRIDDPARIAPTLVAYANGEGGRILVGVGDDGDLLGIDPQQERHVLLTAAKRHCDPPIFLHLRALRAHRLVILEVGVDPDPSRQHLALNSAGRWLPYVRVEDQTAVLPGYKNQLDADRRNLDPIPILMERHASLVGYLREQGSISVKDYMQMMNISYRIAHRSLEELTGHGVLEREEINGRAWYMLHETE